MALSTKVGSFTKGTSTITGVGFTPKAVMFWFSGGQTSGTWRGGIYGGVGFTTGPANSYAVGHTSRDATSPSAGQRRMVAKAITQIDANGSLHEADLTSFDADGFTLTWGADGSGVGGEINYLALGGSDITGATVVNWTGSSSVANKAVTGVGFTPDLVLHAAAPVATLGSTAGSLFAFGAMNSSGEQWANAVASSHNIAPTDTSRWQRTDSCLVTLAGGSEAKQYRATYVSMDADGFTTNFAETNGVAHQLISLCLQGVVSKLGSFAKSTAAAPAVQAVSGVGFTSKAVLFSTAQAVAATAPGTTSAHVLGGWDASSARLAGTRDTDAVDPPQADSLFQSGKVLLGDSAAGNPPTSSSVAAGTSVDSNGFSLTWDPNSATAIESLYLAIGQTNVAPNAPVLTAPASNSTFDRAVTQRFDWDFSDPDSGDSQSQYDVRYRLTSDTAWTTVTAVSTNTYHDFAGGTFAAGDYEWQARTYDAQGLVGPYSSSSFFTAANAPSAPTITDPVGGGTVNTDPYTVKWSYPSQAAYQLRKWDDNAGAVGSTLLFDTGVVESSTARSRSVVFDVNDRFEHIQVRVRDTNGLWSTYASVRVNVSYTRPATPSLTAAADSTAASITVTLNPGSWPVSVSSPVFTGTGDGTMTGPTATAGTTDSHDWTATVVTAAADGGTFDVAKGGVVVGQAVVGTQFTHEGLSFTINDGATDFAVGDKFAWSTTAVKTSSQDVYRREGSSGDGIRLKAGAVANGTFVDYTPASGVTYEYRSRAFGDNGTNSLSAWTA